MKSTRRHPSTAALVRSLDGELDASAAARLQRHLDGCAECRDRLAEVGAQSANAAAHLRTLADTVPVPELTRARVIAAMRSTESRRARVGRQWRGWGAAAAVAAVLLASLGVGPVRAWVLERLGVDASNAGSGAPVATLPSVRVGGEGSIVSFRPQGATFRLEIRVSQAEGEVLLYRAASDRATAQITRGAGESVLILPSGLLVENEAGSAASYRVALPPSVHVVVLQVGGGAERVVTVPEAELWMPVR